MADLIDPFDQEQPAVAPASAAPKLTPPSRGLADPFDDPNFMPQGVYPRAQIQQEGPGEEVPVGTSVRRAVLGEGRMQFPEMPDIGEVAREGMDYGLQAKLAVASEPDQVIDIALSHYPGASVRQDSMGNPIIEHEGRAFYAWKPGVQFQDVQRLGLQGLAYGKAVQGAAKLGGNSYLSRLFNSLAAAGGTSVGLDVAAGMGGSQQGISIPRATTAAAGGALGEAITPAVQTFVNAMRGRRMIADGTLTLEARRVLREQGVDVENLPGEFADYFARQARGAADPAAAARMAESGSLPVPVRETRGTLSQSPSQQMFEDQAAKGAYGQRGEDIMRGVRSVQQEQLRENVPAIQARIGGGVVNETGEGAAIAQAELVAARARAKQWTDAAYKKARERPALVDPDAMDEFAGEVQRYAGDFVPVDDVVRGKVAELRALSEGPEVPVEALFEWRRSVSNLYRSPKDRQQAAGLKELLRGFDEQVPRMVDEALLAGDEEAARLWGRAVRIRRGAGRRYESNDLIAALTETEYAGGNVRLTVAPGAAANYILGKGNLGFMSQPELGRELSRLRARLGAGSEGWRGIKEEAFLRFARQAEGGMDGPTRQFSGTKFLKAWEDANRKNPTLMRTLFNQNERELIGRFARVAARITTPVRGGSNPSGTGAALANAVQKLMQAAVIGPTGTALLSRIFPPLYDMIQSGRIAAQVGTQALEQKALPAGVAGAVGAIGGSQVDLGR